ncbi:MAG TPA: tRNA pseudouridine(38-40) synthase TruA [Longimicrobiales bacterium]|nr:tRNA pseudouridine(38-40) synthase TruA [Longimicrobiales bacterium]
MTPGEEIHRLKLTIHYDGTGFHGWQAQAVQRTVQGELEAALERLTGRPGTVVGSGRTDTGVHATGQVASVDLPVRWSPAELRRAMNAVLPGDVWIAAARRVGWRFHPRFHATARTYEYRLGLSERAASPFHRPWCWALREKLDPELLHRAAATLTGERSFRAFAKAGQPRRGHLCRIATARWSPWEGLGLRFTVTADRYLHRMVRYLVGTMLDQARGRRPPSDLEALLEESDPELRTSRPAPPEGLFLVRVEYPPDVERPERGDAAADGI